MSKPGDGCPNCGGFIIVVNTIRSGLATIRYLGCRGCGHRPFDNKLVEAKPGAVLPARRRKTSSNNKHGHKVSPR